MKTQSRYARSVRHILASAAVVAMAASAQGQAPSDTDPATRISKKLPKQGAAAVQASMVRTGLAPAGVDREFLRFEAAMTDTDPAELPVRTVEVLDDATIARGGSRGLPVAQVPVYLQNDSCLRGHFLNDDDTHGLGTWFAQASFDCPPGFPLCRWNGWQVGDAITGYEVSYFLCSSLSANDCSVTVELWDGDPHGIVDTVCNPTPSPIAGTKTTFSGLTRGVYHDLRAHLPAPVTYNCDRVWIAVSMIEGCRGSWLLGGQPPFYCYEDPADIGWGNGYGANWDCQARGYCDTPSGYGAGTCCTTGEACDYTDADPNNWTGDCQEGGVWPPDCPSQCSGYFTHPTFCSDGYADYYFYSGDYSAYGYYYAQPGAVYAATDKYMALVPVSADAPPDQNPTPDGWRISGNEIILANPGRPVWLEIRISDLDPEGSRTRLRNWTTTIDSSGYSNTLGDPPPPERPECEPDEDCLELVGFGSVCEVPSDCLDAGLSCFQCNAWGIPCLCTPVDDSLVPYTPACATDADCEALMGSLGHPWGGAKGGCGVTGVPQGLCAAGFIDNSRSDYIFYGNESWAWVDLTTLDYRYGSAALDWNPAPDWETYAGTLVLAVPANAKGTFTINLKPWPDTVIRDYYGSTVLFLGLIPAKITVGGSVIDPLVAKNRYLSFVPGMPGKETALRVTFKDLPAPYNTWNDTSMWVGRPVEYCENSGQATPPAQGCGPAPGHWPTYWASMLQCDQHYRYWSTLGVVHMFHEGVIPGATYEIQSIEAGHDISVEDYFSAPVEIRTSIWGDIVRNCTTYPCGPPDGSVDVTTDVTAVLDKFRNLGPPATPVAAVAKARADIEPQTPDQLINITDVSQVLNAFRGFTYPFSPSPPPCSE